jgi:restriction system protein
MARRSTSKEAPIATLFKAPWWISIVIGVVVLVVLKWIVPATVASNMSLKPLAAMLSGLAWLFSWVFFFVGLLSFAREKFAASRLSPSTQQPAATWKPRVIVGRQEPSASGFPKIDQPGPKPDRVWDEMRWGSAAASPKPAEWSNEWGKTATKPKPTEWSIELLRNLEWKRFEDVCQKFYELKGIRSQTTPLGPDGGIDIRLYQDDSGKPTSIVQCKAWGKRYVGVQPVRELLGVMTHEKIDKAFFMASGNFSDEAKSFAQSNPIALINGDMLVSMIKRLPVAEQQVLLAFATEGDFVTPTCPSCGIKMRRVAGTNGRPEFWGCQNYPRCRQKLGMRADNRSCAQA